MRRYRRRNLKLAASLPRVANSCLTFPADFSSLHVVLLVLSVWAVDSDVSLLVANVTLALLKSVDLLLSEASNLVRLSRLLIGRAMRIFLRLIVDLLCCFRKVAVFFDDV
jgi:hypothetical protein